MSINPSDSIPPSQMKQLAEQLRRDQQQHQAGETQQSTNTKFSKSPTTFNAADEQAFQYRSPSDFTNTRDFSSPRGGDSTNNLETNQLNQSSENTAHLILQSSVQQQPPINPIGQLSVGERQPETNNMLPELSQQHLSQLPTSQDIPINPIGQLADGDIKPNDSNINTDAKHVRIAPPTHPIAQGIISEDDPIRLRDTAHPSVNFDDVAARQSGVSPRKRDSDLTPNEKLDIGGPSAMVTEEHMTEGSESPSTAAKLKAKVEITKEKLKGKVEDWKEERQAKEEEKKRRKEYRDVVGESDPSLGDRIREKWEGTKHKIGDKIDELKDRHEEKKRLKERERELKEADHMTSDRGQI